MQRGGRLRALSVTRLHVAYITVVWLGRHGFKSFPGLEGLLPQLFAISI
jgi:hypothetical protein